MEIIFFRGRSIEIFTLLRNDIYLKFMSLYTKYCVICNHVYCLTLDACCQVSQLSVDSAITTYRLIYTEATVMVRLCLPSSIFLFSWQVVAVVYCFIGYILFLRQILIESRVHYQTSYEFF